MSQPWMHVDPRQVPTDLKEPAMDAGHPPDIDDTHGRHYTGGHYTDVTGAQGGPARHQCGGCGDPIVSSYDKWLSVFSGQRACRGYWREESEAATS